MEKAKPIVRILLGLMMVIFGLNGFLQFMPMPEPSAEMGAFLGALAKTGYMFPLIAILQIVAGILFLLNKYTPLALVLLAPVMVNALLTHLFLHDIAGIGAAAMANAMIIFLFYSYRKLFLTLLKTSHYENS